MDLFKGDNALQGNSALALDAKGRIAIPTRYRAVLADLANSALTLTKGLDNNLLVYPRPIWVEKRDELMAMQARHRHLVRTFIGNALDVEIDSSGRILISPELRKLAGLTKDVVLVGLGHYFELWDSAQFDIQQAQDCELGMPDDLESFSL